MGLLDRINESSYWLLFLNRATFFDNLQDPHRRSLIQPSLVLSALAMSNLMQSSELERGHAGRNRALAFRDAAQASMEAACNANEFDFTLAEAALVSLFLQGFHCHFTHAQSSLGRSWPSSNLPATHTIAPDEPKTLCNSWTSSSGPCRRR
jgi:hypothetical protein